MKKITLLIACCMAITLNSTYAQNSNEKKHHYLRDYKAPDFKLKRYDVTLNMNGGNKSINNSLLDGRFGGATMLGYSQYSNKQDYQGRFGAKYRSNISWSKSDSIVSFFSSNELSLVTENRFYYKPKWFFGVYGDVFARHFYLNQTEQDGSINVSVGFTPTIAIGSGRLEPIQYARNAMDIEKQLTKGNRLNQPYSLDQLNKIADQLAIINNVRFYDFRLRRIEQFEAIDKTLREIGGVSEFDITYFAHLADAYLYAQNFPRFSGFRNEVGLTNATDLRYNVSMDNHNNVVSNALYYTASYHLPASYAIQHRFTGTAIFGASTYFITNFPDGSFTDEEAFLLGGYELGLYPTTRTNFNFGANIGVDVGSVGGKDLEAELYANGSVYMSPQFRISFEANFTPENSYFPHYFRSIPNINSSNNSFVLGGAIRLNYAIF